MKIQPIKYLVLLLLLCPIIVHAQFKKGDKMLGGSIHYSRQIGNDILLSERVSTATNFNIMPELGVFLSDKFAISVRSGYRYRWQVHLQSSGDIEKWESHNVSAGFGFRKFYRISDKFYVSFDAYPNIIKEDFKWKSVDSDPNFAHYASTIESTNYIVEMQLMPVFCFFPGKNWNIEATAGNISFQHYISTIDSYKLNMFGIQYGRLGVGLRYYFRPKSK
jgi:hypothetical protein